MRSVTLVTALLLAALISRGRADDVADLRKRFLGEPTVGVEIKQAIEKGVVVLGMCPLQAFAAAGLPGLYQVKADQKKWRPGIPPPVIINAQCDKPDDSVIWLTFRSKTQFGTSEPTVFYVRFEKGRATLVTRTHKFTADGT